MTAVLCTSCNCSYCSSYIACVPMYALPLIRLVMSNVHDRLVDATHGGMCSWLSGGSVRQP